MPPEALGPPEAAHGGLVLATTVRPEACTDVELLQASQEHPIPVEPGYRWRKNPAALRPGRLEKPERMAAWALLTVGWWLVYAVRQRQVRRGWIILFVGDGVPLTHVAAIVGINRRFVYKWVQRFLREGLQGLADKPRSGREQPPDLDGEAHTHLAC